MSPEPRATAKGNAWKHLRRPTGAARFQSSPAPDTCAQRTRLRRRRRNTNPAAQNRVDVRKSDLGSEFMPPAGRARPPHRHMPAGRQFGTNCRARWEWVAPQKS